MRIAHFIDDYSGSGGTERVASNLTFLFESNGIQVPVIFSFVPLRSNPFFDYGPEINVVILDRGSPSLIDQINQKCDQFRIDIIIFHGYHSLFFNPHFAEFGKLKCKFVLRTAFSSRNFLTINPKYPVISHPVYNIVKFLNFHISLKKVLWKKLSLIASRNSIVVVSERCKKELDQLLESMGVTKTNVFCIHNPILFPLTQPATKEKLVLYVGRLREKKKNTMLIIKSWKRIHKNCNGWTLNIIGEGELGKRIGDYIRKGKLTNVRLVPPQKNIQDFYSKSQIVLCSSNSDALPQALVEGAYFSNALISTSFDGGVDEIIEHGKNGYIVPKNDVKRFSTRLIELIKNDELRKRMMSESPSYTQKFDPSQTVNLWKTVLSELKIR